MTSQVVDDMIAAAIPGKQVKLTVEDGEYIHDLTGHVADVSIAQEFDGTMTATFTIVGYDRLGGIVDDPMSVIFDASRNEIFTPDPPKPKHWICVYCFTENPPEGDGSCVRCGGPKGESIKPLTEE